MAMLRLQRAVHEFVAAQQREVHGQRPQSGMTQGLSPVM
jgi:hypothetical protein